MRPHQAAHDVIEIEDIADTATYGSPKAANSDTVRNDETLIIELTSEQIDAMLAGKWPLE